MDVLLCLPASPMLALVPLCKLASSCLAQACQLQPCKGLPLATLRYLLRLSWLRDWGVESSGKHFLVDFVAACPYDLLVKTAGGSVRYQAWVRMPKLLRLHRVVVWYQKKVVMRTLTSFPWFVAVVGTPSQHLLQSSGAWASSMLIPSCWCFGHMTAALNAAQGTAPVLHITDAYTQTHLSVSRLDRL